MNDQWRIAEFLGWTCTGECAYPGEKNFRTPADKRAVFMDMPRYADSLDDLRKAEEYLEKINPNALGFYQVSIANKMNSFLCAATAPLEIKVKAFIETIDFIRLCYDSPRLGEEALATIQAIRKSINQNT